MEVLTTLLRSSERLDKLRIFPAVDIAVNNYNDINKINTPALRFRLLGELLRAIGQNNVRMQFLDNKNIVPHPDLEKWTRKKSSVILAATHAIPPMYNDIENIVRNYAPELIDLDGMRAVIDGLNAMEEVRQTEFPARSEMLASIAFIINEQEQESGLGVPDVGDDSRPPEYRGRQG